MAIPTITPSSLQIGVTAEWVITLKDYPSPTWTLSYALVKTDAYIAITADQYGESDQHHINIRPSGQTFWEEGTYRYQARVTDGDDVREVETGIIEILPNYSVQLSGKDTRSHAQICLENISAVIEGRASQSQQQYSIAGRALQFVPLKELVEMRSYWLGIVNAEKRAARLRKTGGSKFRRINVQFT